MAVGASAAVGRYGHCIGDELRFELLQGFWSGLTDDGGQGFVRK